MSISTHAKDQALDFLLPPGCSASLHLCSCGDGTQGEIVGKGYRRQRIDYAPANNGAKTNLEAVTFADLPEVAAPMSIQCVGVWHPDGMFLWEVPLDQPESTPSGGVLTLPPGHILHVLK